MADASLGVQKITDIHVIQPKTQHNSMINIFQSLLLVIAGATQKELARQVKYLKVENEILRSRLGF